MTTRYPEATIYHPKDLLLQYVEGLLPTQTTKSIRDHVEDCPECNSEVQMLSGAIELLRIHKEVFCPEPWEIAEFAAHGEDPHGILKRHLQHCPSCSAEFAVFSQPEEPTPIPPKLWAAIQRELPAHRKIRNHWSLFEELRQHIVQMARMVRGPFIALGAVTAAIFVIVFMHGIPKNEGPVVALSSVNWHRPSPDLLPKGSINLMGAARRKPLAAIVIYLNSKGDAPPTQQIDALYEQLKPNEELTKRINILAPERIKETLGPDNLMPMSREELLSALHDRCDVSLAALVSLTSSRQGYGLSTELVDLPSRDVLYKTTSGPFPESELTEQVKHSVFDGLRGYKER